MSSTEASIRERAKAAVLGAFVADAATMGLHWIYGADKVAALLEGGKDPAFFEPPSCPFYKAAPGSFSPYGDEAFATLQSIVKHGGVQGAAMTQDLADAFAVPKGYVNGVSKRLVENVRAGKTFPDASPEEANPEVQNNVKVPLVVARYAGKPELQEKVLEASRSHQRSAAAESYALAFAAALEQIVLGKPLPEAIANAQEGADAVAQPVMAAAVGTAVDDDAGIIKAIGELGTSCRLPGSFQGPLIVALHSNNFADAVRVNIRAGGDQAGRVHEVAALVAAAAGPAAIPAEWAAKVTQYAEVEALVEQLLAQRE